jgi:ferritin-like metal-binding protein YciE
MSRDIKEIYATSLRNTRAAELQGIHAIATQLKGLEHYPDLERVLRDHQETTHRQIVRLENALKAIGEDTSAIKDTVTSTAGVVGAAVHALMGDETLKNLYAGYAYQFEQIAAYRSLIVIAEAAGQADQVPEFRKAVEEEEAGAKAVAELIEPVTRRYIERATTGRKADS